MNENSKRHIRQLLERYYNGDSSAAEEIELREFFKRTEADGEFTADRAIFEAMIDTESVEVPEGFDAKLSKSIDSWEQAETRREVVKKKFSIKLFRLICSIAATVAVIIAVTPLLFKKNTPQPVDTFTDPMEAYTETQRVLTFFAQTLDKSRQGIETAERSQEKALNIALDQLNKL